MRTLKILTLAFLSLLLLLVVSRCRLLALGVRQLLEMQGAGHVTVRVARVSPHSIRFETIAFSLPLAGDRLNISLHNLTATYGAAILRNRRLDTISIDSLALRLPEKSGPPSSSPFRLPPLPAIPDSTGWQDRIPLHRLTIGRLRLSGRGAGIVAGKDLSLALVATDRTVHGTLAMTAAGETLRLRLDLSRHNRLELLLEDGQGSGISRLALHPDGNGLGGEFTIRLAALSRLAPLQTRTTSGLRGTLSGRLLLAAGTDPLFSLNMLANAAGTASLQTEQASLRLRGTLRTSTGEIILDNGSRLSLTGLKGAGFAIATADLALAGTYGRQAPGLLLKPAADRGWILTGVSAPGWRCEQLQIKPALSLALQPDLATLVLTQAFRLQATGLTGNATRLTGLELAPGQRTEIIFRPGRWSVRPGDWRLEPFTAAAGGFSLRVRPLTIALKRLEGGRDNWIARGDLSSPGLVLAGRGRRMPISHLRLHIEADQARLRGKAGFALDDLPGRLEAILVHEPAASAGRLELHTPQPVRFSRNHPLADLLPGVPLDLDQGTLELGAEASWSAGSSPSLRLDISLADGRGKIGELAFSGLQVREKLQILPRLSSLVPATISLKSLDAGIMVHDIKAKIALVEPPAGARPALRIDRIAARLLGGRVTTSGLTLDPARPGGRFTITISGIDLAEVVRIMQVKDLQVSGTVDGRLPVRLDRKGISVRDGELHNRPPGGAIRYRPEHKGGLAGMELTAYALKAMEDFRYNLLTARVDYRADGQLNVSLHMEGHSPKLETTRPVHLNIHTEQNLLSLLKSLRYSRNLTEELDRSVQQHYSPAPTAPVP